MERFDEILAACGVTDASLLPFERRALDEHGVVILRDLVQGRALEDLRASHELRFASPGDAQGKVPGQQPAAAGRVGAARNVELEAWADPAHRVLFTHPRLMGAVHAVLQRPFRLFLLGGRNPARGHGLQGLHQDWLPRRPGEPARVVTALWALDDFTPGNGATRVVPGSHRLVHALGKSFRQPHARHPDEMPVLPEAGAVLVFDGHLWHAGGENRSGAPRRSYQVQFVACDSAPPPGLPDALPEHLGEVGRALLGVR
jgi:ectoine hydroxylase-related dioxygenase (phytanoyl-CoA dioxygenase family)